MFTTPEEATTLIGEAAEAKHSQCRRHARSRRNYDGPTRGARRLRRFSDGLQRGRARRCYALARRFRLAPRLRCVAAPRAFRRQRFTLPAPRLRKHKRVGALAAITLIDHHGAIDTITRENDSARDISISILPSITGRLPAATFRAHDWIALRWKFSILATEGAVTSFYFSAAPILPPRTDVAHRRGREEMSASMPAGRRSASVGIIADVEAGWRAILSLYSARHECRAAGSPVSRRITMPMRRRGRFRRRFGFRRR